MTPLVHVIDDEPDVREALALLLKSVGLESRLYGNASEFLAAGVEGRSGCLLVDVRLPGISGLELQARLASAGVVLPVIVMSGHGDIPMAVRAMRAGAIDFIEKPFNDQALLDRVNEAIAASEARLQGADEAAAIARRLASLSDREREVMALVVDGVPNKRIADLLGLSIRTVEAHRAHIMDKMQARSLSHLVRMAVAASESSRPAPSSPDGPATR